MDVQNCYTKFRQLLHCVFEGKIVLTNNNIEKIIKLLGDRTDNNPAKILLESPCLSDLIIQSLENIHSASNSVKVFVIQIITLLFKNELQFSKMQMQVLKNINNLNTASLAYLQHTLDNLYLAQISHCSGLRLIIENETWKRTLHPNVGHQPISVSRAAYTFIKNLIWRLDKFDLEKELFEVINFIIKPITESKYKTAGIVDLETEKSFCDKILPYMSALLAVLSETDNIVTHNHVLPILKRMLLYDSNIYKIFELCRYPELVYLLNSCIARFHVAMYTTNHLHNGRLQEFCTKIVARFRNSVIAAVNGREVHVVIHIVVQWNIVLSEYVKSFKAKGLPYDLTFTSNGQQLELPDQMILHLTIPLLLYANVLSPANKEMVDLIEIFRTKLGKTISEHIFSCCYIFKSVVERSDLKQNVIQTLKELFRLKGHLIASQAGILFQSLYYVLDKFIQLDGAGGLILDDNTTRCPDEMKLLSLLLNVIKMLLMEHNISWYEHYEIINLQAGLMNLLKQNTLMDKQIILVLDLIDICVKKFLSPNMTLLVESRQDSTLNEIGALMKTHIQHEDWAVRDSALNLLLSCTEISFIKYIPLQKVICENDLMILAAKVALTDPDYYAQCTALKCVAAASRIENIWRMVLMDNQHFYFQLIYILRNNPEGMVRQEAAKVLTRIYANQKLSQTLMSNLYEVMQTAALHEMHWEVQLAALKFWKHVINSHMTYRGMIDGKFPSVTFSKSKRKIIVLNEKEIVRQLTNIMDDLSSIGCLTVLLDCMDDINHTEVMEQAYTIAKELIDTLDKYKFTIQDITLGKNFSNPSTEVKQEITVEQMVVDLNIDDIDEIERDKVIDSILQLDQSELLMNLHDSHILTKAADMDENYSTYMPSVEITRTSKFLQLFKSTDYLSRINLKKTWNTGVGSLEALLDEILDLSDLNIIGEEAIYK